jgi:hypothetical protein
MSAGLSGQETTDIDTASVDSISWISSMAIPIRDAAKPRLLYYVWDEWGHSDLAATTANPFVPADLKIGAAVFDGSLGIPVLAANLPAMTIPGQFRTIAEIDEDQQITDSDGHFIALSPAPLDDTHRNNQTFFHWDQGDYVYKDVQVGGAVQIDESRNILMAGRGLNHPGRYYNSGPSAGDPTGNVLQNYLFDYRRDLALESAYNYTAMLQIEKIGIPYGAGLPIADRRRSKSWSHGLQWQHTDGPVALKAHIATMYNELTIAHSVEDVRNLALNSISSWAAASGTYAWTESWLITGSLQRKTRRIDDDELGYDRLETSLLAIGLARSTSRGVIEGRLLYADGVVTLGGKFATRLGPIQIDLRSDVSGYLPVPHRYRRRAAVDKILVQYEEAPAPLRNSVLGLAYSRHDASVMLELGAISALDDDQHDAISLAFHADWEPWTDALKFESSFTAVQSDATDMFPIVGNGQLGMTFTLPLEKRRARPFVSAQAHFLRADFDQVYDPRYADFISPTEAPDGITQGGWISVGGGIKVANFQLEFQMVNVTRVVIPNSVILADGTYYLESAPLTHYSVSWRFLPEL